jgi:hypothetical protein
LKRLAFATAAIAAAVVVLGVVSMPPRRLALAAGDDGTVPGVLHIHTNRSDGRGTPDEIAAAAARAGLKFVVFTDHGNGTRAPDPPAYRSGVLCIDAVEISTTGGHYIALGMPRAPYPLGGEPQDVVEDVARLGGFGIAAHPGSPKPELAWRGWDAPIDGAEILNLDSAWRRLAAQPGLGAKMRLLGSAVTYPLRAPETIASFVAPSGDTIARWDHLSATRRIVGVAGADAHSNLTPWNSEPASTRLSLPFPGYETSFRTLSIHVRPRAPLTGNASADAGAVLDGIRGGNLYVAVDGLASPSEFAFTGEYDTPGGVVTSGGSLSAGQAITLRVRSNAPEAFTTTIWQGSRQVAAGRGRELSVTVPGEPAAYRAEIHASDRAGDPVWILSNPIYVRAVTSPSTTDGEPDAPPPNSESSLDAATPIFDGQNFHDWNVEHDPSSSGSVVQAAIDGERALELEYQLAANASPHAYVALLRDLSEGLHGAEGVAFTARADRPMRVSVQLRTGAGLGPQDRWQRSVYVDASSRRVRLDFSDFTPVGDSTTTERPSIDRVRYVMFVVDETNTPAGASGRLAIAHVDLGRQRARASSTVSARATS